MELELTNGQRVVTMDYKWLKGKESDNAWQLYELVNTYVSALWCGRAEDLPANGITYNFKNGSKIVIKRVPGYDNAMNAYVYDSTNKLVYSAGPGIGQNAVLFLTTCDYSTGTQDGPEITEGKPTLDIGNLTAREGDISDISAPTGNNQPIMVEMYGRALAYSEKEVEEVRQGVLGSALAYNAIVLGSVVPSDPYNPGGNTQPGGGEGDFDGTSDPIDIPALPSLSAADTGFVTLFNPTLPQLKNLAEYMWSDLFDINGWKKIFADPMQAILGLSIVPFVVPSPTVKEVKVGNIPTGVSMSVANSQYVEIDCGTLTINEYWGSYLDYDPHTKAEIYLPYCGIHPISVDDIMKKPVHVVYHIDILSGSCCAYVKCGTSVLYSFIGQCSSSIPITGDNWTNVINGALSIAGSIGSMVATGGASAPMAVADIASTSVNSMKPSIGKSGAMSGTGGQLAVQTPYIILTRPRQAVPAKQNEFTGYPSFINVKLGEVSGYTEVEKIHLTQVLATEQEINEIETLLKSGVIF